VTTNVAAYPPVLNHCSFGSAETATEIGLSRMRAAATAASLWIGQPAWSGPQEDIAFASMENYCLLLPRAAAIASVIAIGGQKAEGPAAEALMAPARGEFYFFRNGQSLEAVAFTTDDLCLFFDRNASGAEVDRLVRDKLRNNVHKSSDERSQRLTYYAVTFQGRHFLIRTTVSTLASIDGVIVSVIPEATIARSGEPMPTWPK
jgi:hypothetical protein